MSSLAQQISSLATTVTNLQAMIQGVRYQGLFFSMFGDNVVKGCAVTNDLYAATAIVSNSIANPTVVNAPGHGLPAAGCQVEIVGNVGSSPSINGLFTATYVDANYISLSNSSGNINVTTGGTGGTIRQVTMLLSLNGQASWDTAHLNPYGASPPVRPEQYWNCANVYGEVFFRDQVNVGTVTDTSLTISTAPGAGYHRYDYVYAYLTNQGPMLGVMAGTAVANASTPTLPTLPITTFGLAQVHVKSGVTGICTTNITDLRQFSSNLTGATPVISSTSSTNLTIATGTQTLTTQANAAYVNGMYVNIANTAIPTNNMEGIVTSYAGTTLVVNVESTSGSGTFSTWTVSLSGAPGASGGISLNQAMIATSLRM